MGDGVQLVHFRDLDPGDCVRSPTSSTQRALVPVVDCGRSHAEEAMGGAVLEAGPWAGTDAVDAAARAACDPAFSDYVGISPAESVHRLLTIDPAEDNWSSGDRWVLCLVGTSSVSGSVEGAGT